MSSLNERLNNNSNETFLGTGRKANAGKKFPINETVWVDTIPVDRHRFSYWASYLNEFSEKINGLALETCKKDCNRKLSYTHGKNIGKTDDLLQLCSLRCQNQMDFNKNLIKVFIKLKIFYN